MARPKSIDEAVEAMFDQYFGPAKAAKGSEARGEETKDPSLGSALPKEAAQEPLASSDIKEARSAASWKKQDESRAETPDNLTYDNMTDVDMTPVILTDVDSAQSKMDIKSNFIKVDMNVFDTLLSTLDASAQAVYMRLYRLSWGFRECACEVTVKSLSKACNMSGRTVQRAIDRLVELRYIEHRIQKSPGVGNLYRVYLPHEIPELREKIARVPEIEHTFEPKRGKRRSDKMTPVKMTYDNLSETYDNLTYDKMTHAEPKRPEPGSSSTPVKMTYDKMTPITEVHVDIDNNNRQTDVVACESFLKERGFTVPRARIKQWAQSGISLSRIKEVTAYVSGWADNPTGALIDAIEKGTEVSEEAKETAAAAEEAERHAAQEERKRQEEQEWIEEEIKRLGPSGMDEIRREAEEECAKSWIYQKATDERIKKSMIEGKVKEIILARRKP